MDCEDGETHDESIIDMYISINRSGLIRKPTEDAESQTEADFYSIQQPPVQKQKNVDIRVKKACVKASVKCNISTAMGVLAVKSVCEEMYGHHYYLTKDDAIENDPSLASYREESVKKKQCLNPEELKKPPISVEDYVPYLNVLPSKKTLNDFKQLLAVQEESFAGKTLSEKSPDVLCIMTQHPDVESMVNGRV